MAPPNNPAWDRLAPALQTEILYNLSADEKQDWSKVVSKLQLTKEEEENAIKHIHRRIAQDEAEERFLKRQQRRRRDYLLGRTKGTALGQQGDPGVLPSVAEHPKRPQLEFHFCTKKELMLARRFLRSRDLSTKLAGDWGISGDEVDEEDDGDTPRPSILPKDDYGFGAQPAVVLRSVTSKRTLDEEEREETPLDFLNTFAKEPRGKSSKGQMQVPLLPLLNSAYEYSRGKHVRKLVRMRDSTLLQIPGPLLSPIEGGQEVRLTVNNEGAADIRSSPPRRMIPLPSSPASPEQVGLTGEYEMTLAPQDVFPLPMLPVTSSVTPIGNTQRSSEESSGRRQAAYESFKKADVRRSRVGAKRTAFGVVMQSPTPSDSTLTLVSSSDARRKAADAASSSKKSSKSAPSSATKSRSTRPEPQAPSPEQQNRLILDAVVESLSPKLTQPFVEISKASTQVLIRDTPRKRGRPPKATALERQTKMLQRRLGLLDNPAAGQGTHTATETPKDANDDVSDAVVDQAIRASQARAARERRVIAEKTVIRIKRKRTPSAAAVRPYTLRSDAPSEASGSGRAEKTRAEQRPGEAIDTPTRMLTRMTARRRSGI